MFKSEFNTHVHLDYTILEFLSSIKKKKKKVVHLQLGLGFIPTSAVEHIIIHKAQLGFCSSPSKPNTTPIFEHVAQNAPFSPPP